eukprot:GILI01004108.1.p1 GENE.GILI01004108.1~~GILI01004108.1.p1  ORF type:complete len:412 (+),score=68.68 GILI01004108.1:113-1237(+)
MLRKSAVFRRIPAIIMIQNSETDGAAYLGHFQKTFLNTNLRLVHYNMFNEEHSRLLPLTAKPSSWADKPFYCTHSTASNSGASTPRSGSSSPTSPPKAPSPVPSCVMAPCDESCEDKIDYHVVGVVSLGGPMSAADDENYPHIRKVMSLMKSAVEEDVPVLGICLGAQILSRALGGTVTVAAIGEMGFVDQTVEPVASFATAAEAAVSSKNGFYDWFSGRKHLPTYHWHGDTFSIPASAVRVATGPYCAAQAFQVPHKYVLGVQWHPDIDITKARTWCRSDGIDQKDPAEPLTPGVMTCGEFAAALTQGDKLIETQALADDIFGKWFEGVYKCKEQRSALFGEPVHTNRNPVLSPALRGELEVNHGNLALEMLA